jgi:ribosomal protein S18 acetylase RimI-like enzyme
MSLSIRRAEPTDAAQLASFSARTFAETYAHANDPADMAQHLSTKYGPAIQEAEIRNPMAAYLLVELDGQLAGYAFLRFEHSPQGVALEHPVELVRFYVAREWHGRGIAQQLMAACAAEARRGGGRVLWLTVWQENARAIAFYRKSGFEIAGTAQFKLGSQLQDDHMMTLELGSVATGKPVGCR